MRALRQYRKYTLKYVADAICVSVSAYSNYEQGIREPSYDILKRICDFYEVTADFLIGRSEY